MRLDVEPVNITELISKWDMLFSNLDEAITEAVQKTLQEGVDRMISTAEEKMYNPESYIGYFYLEGAERKGDLWTGKIINSHPYAQAIEIGTPAHTAGPYGFRVGPDRPPYPWNMPADKRGWRTFYHHYGAKAFNIFGDQIQPLYEILKMHVLDALKKLGGI